MSEPDPEKQERELYEQTQRLFLEALTIPSTDRIQWIFAQTQYSSAVHERVIAMLEVDAEVDAEVDRAVAEPSSSTHQAIPETIALKSVESLPNQPFPKIPNYQIIEEVARGGMGIVYKAQQLRPHRLAAIKMIRSGGFASNVEIERFMTEANAAAQLDDEAVVPVYELGTVQGEPFIAMKFIDGEDLESLLASEAMTLPENLDALLAISQAVACAHDRNIIHRDLKPSNVLVDRTTRRPWVTDFGLAKYLNQESTATSAGEIMGTPGYMAPEQAFGDVEKASAATDVYGLGAILYRMLTGKPPIQSAEGGLAKQLQLIQEHDVTPPRSINRRVSPALNTICMKCLETDPARRYSHAGELVSDLKRFQAGEAIQAKPLGWFRSLHRWARHRPGLSVTWVAAAIFYLYHLLYRSLFQDANAEFHTAVVVTVITLTCGAWIWQRCLTHSRGAVWVLYLWLTSDVLILTVFLYYAGGASSSLVPLYHVLVAGSILRCRTDLVIYTTCLAMASYGIHWLSMVANASELTPPLPKAIPILLSMLLIGVVQYFSLRRSTVSLESQSAPHLH